MDLDGVVVFWTRHRYSKFGSFHHAVTKSLVVSSTPIKSRLRNDSVGMMRAALSDWSSLIRRGDELIEGEF